MFIFQDLSIFKNTHISPLKYITVISTLEVFLEKFQYRKDKNNRQKKFIERKTKLEKSYLYFVEQKLNLEKFGERHTFYLNFS